MKKILPILTFLLITTNLFAQASFARATEFYLGYKASKESKIVWSNGSEVDILVVITESTVKIYSSEIQEYRMVNDGVNLGNHSRYLAIDKNGLQCFLYLGNDEDGNIYTIIEYGDYAWMYYLKPND
jgi:hypothetical protein